MLKPKHFSALESSQSNFGQIIASVEVKFEPAAAASAGTLSEGEQFGCMGKVTGIRNEVNYFHHHSSLKINKIFDITLIVPDFIV